jgi:peroxiredoxin
MRRNYSGIALLGLFLFGSIAAAQAPTVPAPRLKDNPNASRLPAGTVAPDGIGATTAPFHTADALTTENMTYVAWEDESAVKPLPVGVMIPAGSVVKNMDGKSFDLNASIKSQPTILIFYRGGWCPFCNAQLRDLQKSSDALTQMGYQILAVSTDTPEELQKFNEDAKLTYQLFSDVTLDVATKFGLKYKVSQTYIDHVNSLPNGRATDLAAKTGGYLLTPGAFIFDTKGTIRFAYVNNNYAVRVTQDKLLEAARAALK